jgi:uncharacterized protein YjiK
LPVPKVEGLVFGKEIKPMKILEVQAKTNALQSRGSHHANY